MSNAIKIVLTQHVDRATIDLPTIYNIDIEDSFLAYATTEVDINAFDGTTLEAFKKVIDKCSWTIENESYIWKLVVTAKTFSFATSVYRTVEDTTTETEMTAGQSLEVTFETPSFGTYNTKTISLFYDDDFLTTDLDDLHDMGIDITGNGKEFIVSNTVECRISFAKPAIITDVYVIVNDFGNTVIPV